tara:strand:- start:1016 stop:1525 length:510 start_codon:yes stop_codon:yes gene_type:complete
MGKEYTIFIDSEQGTKSGAVPTVDDIDYSFDWSILPQGEYEMSFTFLTPLQKTLVAVGEKVNNAMVVEAVVPFSSNRYKVASPTNTYAQSSNVIGFIKMEQVDKWSESGSHFSMRQWVSQVDNPTLKLYGAPSGNDFKIRLINTEGVGGFQPSVAPVTYNMILKLKHIC